MSHDLPDLIGLFASLCTPASLPSEGISFAVQKLAGYPLHHLGKDTNGRPALLIGIKASSPSERPPPLILEHLVVQHDIECKVQQPNREVRVESFSVIHCLSSERAIQEYFLRALTSIVMALQTSPSQGEVINAINILVELFRATALPSRKSIQGLWAELFLIMQSTDPALLVKSWHSSQDDPYDFCAGAQRVEVKSTSSRLRMHYFSMEQLRSPLGTSVLVASLFVERAAGGVGIFDVVERIRSRISNPDLLVQLDRIIALSLGDSWRQAVEFRFDLELAFESLQYYEGTEIPAVTQQLPPEVTEVRFKSDLTKVPAANLSCQASQGGLFQALLKPGSKY